MIPVVKNTNQLLQEIDKLHFFKAVKSQLNKDFNFSGIVFQFQSNSPHKLIEDLRSQLYQLITSDFSTYLNLLYRIDVSEAEIKKITEVDINEIIEHATFLILKREFQKVWFKSKF